MLAKQFRGTKILEDADNPFLDDFYKDKRGAAFRTELFFLLSRYDQQRTLTQQDLFTQLVIADWNSYSAGHPDWFDEDGIHPTPLGAANLGQFVHNALVRAAAKRTSVTR